MNKFIMLLLAITGALMSTLSMQASANNFFDQLNPKVVHGVSLNNIPAAFDHPMPQVVTEINNNAGKILLEPYKIKQYIPKHKYTLKCNNNVKYAVQSYREDGTNTEITLVSGRTKVIPFHCSRALISHTKAIYVYGFNP